MDYKKTATKIEDFIHKEMNGFNQGFIGLSGGIDSSIVATLAVNALGKDKVYGIIMPYYCNEDTEDAVKLAKKLGIRYSVISIRNMVASFRKPDISNTNLVKGNLMARIRMCVLYSYSNSNNGLVLGTTNKTEMLVGYFTKHGDGAVDIEPIAHLYKTEIFELAKYLKIDKKLIDKKPSAGLWLGQTDEEELGIDYITLDKMLKCKPPKESKHKIGLVLKLMKKAEHKVTFPKNLES